MEQEKPMQTPESSHPYDTSGFLHVIFHGLFCFFELEDYILVRVPFVPPMGGDSMPMPHMEKVEAGETERTSLSMCASEHVYRAGSWLGEMTLQPGFYELLGVNPGCYRFSRDKNFVIQGGRPATNPPNLYAEIRMRYPLRISSIRQVAAPKDHFRGPAIGRVSSENISLIQVFTYTYNCEEDLQLTPHPWSPHPRTKDGPDQNQRLDGFIALHLFAQPDGPAREHHTGHAFTQAMGMFEGVDIKLITDLDKPPDIRIADLPFGTRIEEMLDLDDRAFEMAYLGLLRKEGRDLNRAFKYAWRTPIAAANGRPSTTSNSDPERCGTHIGG